MRDLPDPSPAAGEVLVRVDSAGICGSDMHAYLGHDERRPAPLVLGHEVSGVIVGGARDAARVTINPLVACGSCAACQTGRENLCPNRQIISMPPREGGFAQFVTIPEANVVIVPGDVSMEKAALAEPLAVSWHAARLGLEALNPAVEPAAQIIGGGAIGLAAALVLRAMGCEDITVIEPNAARRAYISDKAGLKTVAQAQGETSLVVDAVGYAATREVASAAASPGGVILHIGLGSASGGLDIRRLTLQEIAFIGTYTYTAQDFRDTAAAMFAGRLGALDWIEARPLSQGAAAFDDIRNGRVAAPKIILKPDA